MLICIPEVLSRQQVAFFRETMAAAEWVDGRVTAGSQSALVKNNLQLPEDGCAARELGDRVLDALGASTTFVSAALPCKIFPPLFNSYGVGHGFGSACRQRDPRRARKRRSAFARISPAHCFSRRRTNMTAANW